ncbi:FkbM family methyltransferase [Pedobacter flavus]|uniref:FkbM family methyltransferase n=1 Tax=Pedobacter flavus TaxID=3113906 RepID=A0ABU7H0V6_9SPHI|nr:FkbM family methyltransferase [Pedobacter sp. VNH31]MEE1884663.1 FkbM family methyltransferase [Pedobacter sp. VNH31]
MSTLNAVMALIKDPKSVKALLSFRKKGYLNSIGWFNAYKTKSAIDGQGNAIPWVTYSFIDFIQDRIKKSHLIFEYGSGSSTKYYALRAASVVSVEHDKEWFEKVKKESPSNAEIIFCALSKNGEYSKMAKSTQHKFDLIIVDGRDRVNCCINSVEALSESGVIVLDDSERMEYEPARKFLKAEGFKELSFSGISPGLFYLKSTSVFYKPNNCLDI